MQVKWTDLIELTEYNLKTINEVSGVYRISHRDASDGKYYVHYVGQASNLKERLTQHLFDYETNKCCKRFLQNNYCYFEACAISSKGDRDGAEVALYYNYNNPQCVERIPNVNLISINFNN